MRWGSDAHSVNNTVCPPVCAMLSTSGQRSEGFEEPCWLAQIRCAKSHGIFPGVTHWPDHLCHGNLARVESAQKSMDCHLGLLSKTQNSVHLPSHQRSRKNLVGSRQAFLLTGVPVTERNLGCSQPESMMDGTPKFMLFKISHYKIRSRGTHIHKSFRAFSFVDPSAER